MRIFLHIRYPCIFVFFFFNDTATTEIYTLSLHDALPIFRTRRAQLLEVGVLRRGDKRLQVQLQRQSLRERSEEHTSELQSPCNLVCRLLLEKKNHSCTCPANPTRDAARSKSARQHQVRES